MQVKLVTTMIFWGVIQVGWGAANPEQWSELLPIPARLENFLPQTRQLRYRVGTHFHARFYLAGLRVPAFSLLKNKTALRDPEVELCWGAVQSGARECKSYQDIRNEQIDATSVRNEDLFALGRKLSRSYGMRTALEFLKYYVHDQDTSAGNFERNFVTLREAKEANPQFFTEGEYVLKMGGLKKSLLGIPMQERAKVGIFFLMGMDHDPKKSPRARANIILSDALKQMGFTQALVLQTTPLAPTDVAAREIREDLNRHLAKVDSAIILGMSKAGHEMSQFFAKEFSKMSITQQKKIRGIVTLGGVVRASFMAEWLANNRGATRKIVNKVVGKKSQVNPSLADDVLHKSEFLNQLPDLSHISWINVVVFPDRPDGTVHYSGSEIMRPWLLNENPELAPNDGAVEVGAALPPPLMQKALARNVVLRVLGSHYVTLKGRTLIDGRPLSYEKQTLKDFTAAQADYMGNILGVIPRSWIVD